VLVPCFTSVSFPSQDGPEATFIGMGDHHDPNFDDLEVRADLSSYLQSQAEALNRAYTTVPLNEDFGRYHILLYPSRSSEGEYVSGRATVFVLAAVFIFSFTSIIFLVTMREVQKRHQVMRETALRSARKAAAAEREVNEFLSHEVRNPLSSAMSACCFVSTALAEPSPLSDLETLKSVREDMKIIDLSLSFINDFLRSMLDIHRADAKKLEIAMAPTDVLRDVLQPVATMLYVRGANYEVRVECDEDLIIMTDRLRLKQVSAGNSIYFVLSRGSAI